MLSRKVTLVLLLSTCVCCQEAATETLFENEPLGTRIFLYCLTFVLVSVFAYFLLEVCGVFDCLRKMTKKHNAAVQPTVVTVY
ncbi:unnamed protein product [Caenorhabditis angaria]|uniref:Envelope glycoprotein N n=1 Tax=Caenorhabditis angaria TaxID=860376 RepID=A0A9P1NAP9_9PELO|nr:unnamed protein product [Caenorhabditis angaria]